MTPARVLIAGGCIYELAALASPLPTITTIVARARRHPVGKVGAMLWVGLWAYHFLVD